MRKPIVAAVCVAAALSLAGCSATTTAGSATAGAGTSAGSTPGVSKAGYASALDLATAVSAATKDKGSAKLTFTFGAGAQSFTGTGAYSGSGDDTKVQMSMTLAQEGNIELVLLDHAIYVKIPGAPGGKPWIKASTDGDDAVGKQFAGFGDQVDISKQFEQLKNGGSLTGASPDTVDGVPATRYSVSIDPAKLATNGTPEEQDAMKAIVGQGVKSIDMQIWIDGNNLPVRVSTAVPVQGQSSTFDMHYSDWGQPVDITAPPADQVAEAPH